MSEKHISTSALARLLQKDSKELFILLAKGGWMIKVDNHWQLTEKGKFEGGVYIHHPKFGDYIAWPESVQDHPLLQLLPEAPLSVTQVAAAVGLPARLLNLLLAERGWIKKHLRGWLLTAKGKALGAQQHTNEQTAIPYVTWPESILDRPEFLQAVNQLKVEGFARAAVSLSGHSMMSRSRLLVENWLYLAGVNHACDYSLAVAQEKICADFFVPELQLAIDCWSANDDAESLAKKLAKQAFYQHHGYDYIEVHDEDILQLDELLAKRLFNLNLAVY